MVVKQKCIFVVYNPYRHYIRAALNMSPNDVSRIDEIAQFVFVWCPHPCEMHSAYIPEIGTFVIEFIKEDIFCMSLFILLVF